jgi:hypothetical protein
MRAVELNRPATRLPPVQSASSLFKAGRILILVGAILAAVTAVLAIGFAVGFALIFDEAAAEAAPFGVGGVFALIYGGIGIMSAIGAVFGFLSFRAANAGQVHAAWIRGLIASLVPPVQVVALVGAILMLMSPEHEAWAQESS